MAATQGLSVREAARRAGRSEETIRRWIWSGRLPAVKRGAAYLIDMVRLDEVIVEMEGSLSAHGPLRQRPGPGDSGRPGSADSGPSGMDSWLREVDEWKRRLPVTVGPAASEMLIEDRRGRR